MTEQQSIKNTLEIIRKALVDENNTDLKNEEDILLLNRLVKEDGTINIINEHTLIEKKEFNKRLDDKLDHLFEEHFEKWLDKKLPSYLEKYFKNK